MDFGNLLRRNAAGAYIRSKYGYGSKRTLDKLATVGGGPAYRMMGRIPLYDLADLDSWALSKLSAPARNTSEARSARKPPAPEIAEAR